MSDFPLRAQVISIAKAQRLALKAANIQLKLEIDDIIVNADQDKIRTVVDNLLSNAVKFTPGGGRVTCDARIDDDPKLAVEIATREARRLELVPRVIQQQRFPKFQTQPETAFVTQRNVEWRDLDLLEHVNNATYIRWCENIAWAHSGELGLTVNDYREMQRAMAIHHAEYDYLQACFPGDELQAATWITASDLRLSMERRFQIIDTKTSETVFRGVWQLVCVNLKTNKPVRIPERFIQVYQAAVIASLS